MIRVVMLKERETSALLPNKNRWIKEIESKTLPCCLSNVKPWLMECSESTLLWSSTNRGAHELPMRFPLRVPPCVSQ